VNAGGGKSIQSIVDRAALLLGDGREDVPIRVAAQRK
jgi:hypothetical protein